MSTWIDGRYTEVMSGSRDDSRLTSVKSAIFTRVINRHISRRLLLSGWEVGRYSEVLSEEMLQSQ